MLVNPSGEEGIVRLDEAVAEFQRELALWPGDPIATLRLGMALVLSQRPAEALPYLDRAVEFEPPVADAFHYCARALLAVGRPADAVTCLERALDLSDGKPRPDFVLNSKAAEGCTVLVAGDNFGCGSWREHAPWALVDYGFRAVISTRIADIFRNNALKNGLLPIVVEAERHRQLVALVASDPEVELSVDLDAQLVHLPGDEDLPFEAIPLRS